MAAESPKTDLNSLRINRTTPSEPANGNGGGKGKIITYSVIGLAIVALIAYLLTSGIFSSPEQVSVGTVSKTFASQASAVLTASGYVVASRKAAVGSKGTGRLVFLGVEEGSIVKKDQVIGRLESSDVIAALEQAQASLAASKANLQNAEAGLENADSTVRRTRYLFKQGLAASADLTTAESQYKQQTAQVASAQANMLLAQKGVQAATVQVEFTNIRAPFDGTVLTKDADVGDIMTPFGAAAGSRADIVSLADMSSLDAEVDVSESNIENVHVGQPCEITLDAVPEKRYKGRVHMIVPTADRSKATVLTKVDFQDIDARVLPEMSLKVIFMKDSSSEADTTGPKLTVPATAVVTRNGKKVVFVLHETTVTETPVVLGEAMGSGIEVKQGIAEGDKVVLTPSEKLKTGAKVKTEE
jgi:RND family efflux transporter MFP subunit